MATAVGFEGRTVRRNAPTVLNVAYHRQLFHDGRESTLEQQVWQPLLAGNEMANPSIGTVLDKIRAIAGYADLFQRAFGRGPGMETVGQALASYQRTLLLADSPFDRYYYGGERDALSAEARAGLALFDGRAGCADCHRIGDDYALFSDDDFHNTGIGWQRTMDPEPATHRVQLAPGVFVEVASDLIASASEPAPSDLGRYEITQHPDDRWRYRTPSLRNVALTAPYMHDGSLGTLAEVVAYYDAGGYRHPQLDPRIRPLALSVAERAQLVAFLQALTGNSDDLTALLQRAAQAPVGDVTGADPADPRFASYPD
jgi:cytochrome c peroxidase